jgi:uncharacterized SAM-binding protein YcdF (DUF218 family)
MPKTRKIILWAVLALFLGLVLVLILTFDSIMASMANFLIKGEHPRKADAIIVLSGGTERVPYGAELYHSGYADTVILSGSGRYMTQMALDAGIPESAIIRENRSGTTFDNARYSLMVVQEQGYQSILVVTSPYHTHRAGKIFREFFQELMSPSVQSLMIRP